MKTRDRTLQRAVVPDRVLGFRILASALLVVALLAFGVSAPARAESTDRLSDLLRIEETLGIMREEGMAYAGSLAEDMLSSPPGTGWMRTVAAIYDPEEMSDVVHAGMSAALQGRDADVAKLEAFFGSPLGQQIVGLEVSARRAMIDPAIEETARERYRDAADATGTAADRRDVIARMIEEGGLIEANVAGGLTSSVRFYQGLADGGAIALGEADILAQVWASAGETRSDTTEWLHGFMLMAYGPLEIEDLETYADLMSTPAGRALNAALFEGFDRMFADISYALGRALAREMQSEEL